MRKNRCRAEAGGRLTKDQAPRIKGWENRASEGWIHSFIPVKRRSGKLEGKARSVYQVLMHFMLFCTRILMIFWWCMKTCQLVCKQPPIVPVYITCFYFAVNVNTYLDFTDSAYQELSINDRSFSSIHLNSWLSSSVADRRVFQDD